MKVRSTMTTTTTTTHVIIVTEKKIGILGMDQACLEAVARKRDHLKDNCTKVAFPGLLFSTDIGFFSLVVFVYVPLLAKFKAVQWDDSLPTMDLCTLIVSPFFFQFGEIFKCYESKLSTATILFSILSVGIFLGSLCFEALTSTAENGGSCGWCHVCFGFLVLP